MNSIEIVPFHILQVSSPGATSRPRESHSLKNEALAFNTMVKNPESLVLVACVVLVVVVVVVVVVAAAFAGINPLQGPSHETQSRTELIKSRCFDRRIQKLNFHRYETCRNHMKSYINQVGCFQK